MPDKKWHITYTEKKRGANDMCLNSHGVIEECRPSIYVCRRLKWIAYGSVSMCVPCAVSSIAERAHNTDLISEFMTHSHAHKKQKRKRGNKNKYKWRFRWQRRYRSLFICGIRKFISRMNGVFFRHDVDHCISIGKLRFFGSSQVLSVRRCFTIYRFQNVGCSRSSMHYGTMALISVQTICTWIARMRKIIRMRVWWDPSIAIIFTKAELVCSKIYLNW